MLRTLIMILIFIILGCGNETHNRRSGVSKRAPTPQDTIDYKVVSNITIDVKALSSLSLTSNITYTSSITSTMSIINSDLITPSEDTDGNILNLGSLSIDIIKVNHLKICGAGGNEKCTSAIIRVYTNDLGGANTGLDGFVNITDNYAEAPVNIMSSSGSAVVGHTLTNATLLTTYTIPAKDNKLTQDDFTMTSFPLTVDFSNAGAGDYQMSIELEVAVGPIL